MMTHYDWINFKVEGKGEPIIWLPPFGYDGIVFKKVIDRLGNKYKHVLVDFRRYGQAVPSENALQAIAENLIALCEVEGFKNATVIGAGAGGYHAMEMALIAEDVVEKLVLVNTTLGGEESLPLPQDYMARIFRGQKRNDEDLIYLLEMELNKKATVISRELIDSRVMFDEIRGFENYLLAVASCDVADRVWRIKQETLLICGKQDKVFNPHNMFTIHQRVPHSVFKTMEEGHLCFVADPDTFYRLLSEFLGTTEGE